MLKVLKLFIIFCILIVYIGFCNHVIPEEKPIFSVVFMLATQVVMGALCWWLFDKFKIQGTENTDE